MIELVLIIIFTSIVSLLLLITKPKEEAINKTTTMPRPTIEQVPEPKRKVHFKKTRTVRTFDIKSRDIMSNNVEKMTYPSRETSTY